MLFVTINRGFIAFGIVLVFLHPLPDAFAEEMEAPCENKLSGKAKRIYDAVIEKKQPNSDLNELWKEVTRDLISNDVIGREEATPLAREALSCLNKEIR